jgi:hypothetical protein
MSTETPIPKTETLTIDKADFLAAWQLLERMVVSNRKIGSYFALPIGQQPSVEHQQKMNEQFLAYFGPDFFCEISQVRSRLNRYIDDQEGETLSDSLSYWKPPQEMSKK